MCKKKASQDTEAQIQELQEIKVKKFFYTFRYVVSTLDKTGYRHVRVAAKLSSSQVKL